MADPGTRNGERGAGNTAACVFGEETAEKKWREYTRMLGDRRVEFLVDVFAVWRWLKKVFKGRRAAR